MTLIVVVEKLSQLFIEAVTQISVYITLQSTLNIF